MVNDFRNLHDTELRPAPNGLTVVSGENGAGKTSLLEAIAYCSTLHSFRASPREALIRVGTERAVIRLELQAEGRSSLIETEISPHRRDRVQLNRQAVSRAQDLLEALRVTVFSPDDLVLVKGGPQQRREFLDSVVAATWPRLVPVQHDLERALRQRAALLKQAGGRVRSEISSTLDVWDAQLAEAGSRLVTARELLVTMLSPHTSQAFGRLTRSEATLELVYERSFAGDLASALASARVEDLRRGFTTVGPHRDDLAMHSGGLDARSRLSQGRQRVVTLALRLAAHEVVSEAAGSTPVLLLDDAFSELDDATARALVSELPGGQALLTTAGPIPPGATPNAVLHLVAGAIQR